jgi:exosortase A-associated hydrolase 2
VTAAQASTLDAFFLPRPGGQRLCVLHLPAAQPRAALLHVHAFAEELNITRRMVAQQAAGLAALGHAVLLLDLHGCGDSSGDFGDARWDAWLDDIAAARVWLEQRTGLTAGLWGTRAGALLALAHARAAAQAPAQLLLWQPVVSGAHQLTQFLRLRLAHDALAEGQAAGGTEAMRAQLDAGEALEVAGYTLAPALAEALARAQLEPSAPPPCPVHWFEVAASGRSLPLPVQRIADGWRARGAALELTQVAGPAFWSSHEAAPAPALLEATCAALAGAVHD